jgi:hypothetical protein
MAVIQISRIQVRRGKADLSTPSGLPQLASGEIGWAIDNQQLYIGSGSVEEGARAVENVEILTEYSPTIAKILAQSTASDYTYQLGINHIGESVQPSGAVGRKIQHKLDDKVNAKDFGILDEQNVTVALQKAIDTLYISTSSDRHSPVLEFPSGNYYLTATVYIPPNAKLQGNGKGLTKFTMITTATSLFQTVGLDANNNMLKGLSISGSVDNVSIKGFTFQFSSTFTTTNVNPIMLLDKVHNSEIEDCEFKGTYQFGYPFGNARAVDVRYNIDTLSNTNLHINKCTFDSVTNGILLNDDTNNVKITNNKFYNAYRGVVLRELTGISIASYGPQNTHITENHFDKIYHEAVWERASTATWVGNISSKNIYQDVGNEGDTDAVTSVIKFGSRGNQSIDDTFERFTRVQPDQLEDGTLYFDEFKTYPVVKQLVEGGQIWTSGPLTYTVDQDPNDPSLTRPLVVIPYETTSKGSITVDYVLKKNTCSRSGKLTITLNGTIVKVRDDYSYDGSTDGEIEFTGEIYGNAILLKYGPNSVSRTYTDSLGSVTLKITLTQ